MLIAIFGSMTALICFVIYCTMFTKMKQLSTRIKALEEKADEVETIHERGTRRFAESLMEHYREDTAKQTKCMDEAIKIFDERRSALENQMNLTLTMTDTLVDAFKYRLNEAEKDIAETNLSKNK